MAAGASSFLNCTTFSKPVSSDQDTAGEGGMSTPVVASIGTTADPPAASVLAALYVSTVDLRFLLRFGLVDVFKMDGKRTGTLGTRTIGGGFESGASSKATPANKITVPTVNKTTKADLLLRAPKADSAMTTPTSINVPATTGSMIFGTELIHMHSNFGGNNGCSIAVPNNFHENMRKNTFTHSLPCPLYLLLDYGVLCA
jgi:hypothetical protein